MEIETLFTEQRWKILSELSKGKYSPLQLAKKSDTTMANISQQLRLLEFSNLVKKEKIPNRDKGKPRTLFSLADDYAYLVSVMNGFADKKLVKLDNHHKVMLKIWFLENQQLHYYLEKFILDIEEYLQDVDVIMLKQKKEEIDVTIGSKNSNAIEKKIKDVVVKKSNNNSMNFKVKIYYTEELEKLTKKLQLEEMFFVYDPHRIISKLKEGGDS